ncbi:septum formation protein [Salinibacillus kushneri]|uniref:dTTP/UTP pyrophosphatase n=1 Tax=Salinibacillus kushneri TaxID=237682 RepID=A0A1I0JH53_9BACI|nr:Maf family protein [Salinibacillus kushneri]SEU08775.1 septum formation protein [Salinibacillus kushneri]
MTSQLVLASSSPRRQELLEKVQVPFVIRKPDVDESSVTSNTPKEKVWQLAKLKGEHVIIKDEREVILAADTVVSYRNQIFEKPNNEREAFQMLSRLSGERHEVWTGFMIRSNMHEEIFTHKTEVEFWPLSDEEIEAYLSTQEAFDKAGAYGIQGQGSIFVKQIIGDYYNVVGLPVSHVVRELRKYDIFPSFYD